MNKVLLSIVLIIIIILLVLLLVWGMGLFTVSSGSAFALSGIPRACVNGINFNIGGGLLPNDAESGTHFELPLSDINTVKLNFVDENIVVIVDNGKTVRVEQTGSGNLSGDDLMRFGKMGNTLVAESGVIGKFNAGMRAKHTITLYLPQEAGIALDADTTSGEISLNGGVYTDLKMDSTSGEIDASSADADYVSADTTSGRVELKDIRCGSLHSDTTSGDINISAQVEHDFDANSTSGKISFSGSARTVNADTMSGTVNVEAAGLREVGVDSVSGSVDIQSLDSTELREIDVDTTSGAVKIRLPKNSSISVDYDTISGSFSNDFDSLRNGDVAINVSTISGSLEVSEN